ncbi:nitrilase-related carbon-nitrogen hydrolase [Pseudomonas sp. RIT623]|uniref:nitrilase-related carbon-nitrogen hydrolase n=1 Tax=Pseudomonas sp. RIT623 TaxID=2559075 RepID=UPI00106FA80B|nr:nitrilase-related carbon-nitrogen hydrolase [Pseudomonas sp. RIT623]TFF42437.1 carbon-nitrogen hydrolase [Pseudomonas sp. RIT623]
MNSIQRVACQQLAPELGQSERNLARSLAAISEAAHAGARLVVLPELALSGYAFRDRAEAYELAEERDGPALAAWAERACRHDVIVVGGFCERLADGAVANSSVLIEPDGRRTFYRKAHLWDRETLIFTPGDQPPPVITTAIGRVAMMICYDLEFPEWVRLVALSGAQLLCAPVNWPDGPRPRGQRPAEVTRVQANASLNRLFMLACDRSGEERGVRWVGGSSLVDANGYLLAGGETLDHPQLLLADIALEEADEKRISSHNHVLHDRRPQLYHGLLRAVPCAQ